MTLRQLLSISVILFAMQSVASAQTPVTIAPKEMKLRLGGSLQTRVSFLSNPNLTNGPTSTVGFGVRRARIRLFGDLRPDFRLFMQLEGSGTSATLTDLRAEWDMTSETMLRFGRFAGAQPRGMAFTLMFDVDAIDRPAIMEHWARSTRGTDARDYGIEMVHRRGDVELRGMLHNGGNTQNFRAGIADASPSGGIDRGALATSTMLRVLPSSLPNSEFGVHVGYNPTKSVKPRTYTDWSAHAYWGDKIGTQPTRFKFDAVGIHYADLRPMEQSTLGFSLLAGQLVRPDTELFARAERLNTTIDEFTHFTIGATYALWDWTNKFTLAWSMRSDLNSTSDPIHLVTIQSQFHF